MPGIVEICEKEAEAILQPLRSRREQCTSALARVRGVVRTYFFAPEQLLIEGLLVDPVRAALTTCLDVGIQHPMTLDAAIRACFPGMDIIGGLYVFMAPPGMAVRIVEWHRQLATAFSVLRTVLSLDLLCWTYLEDPFLDITAARDCLEAVERLIKGCQGTDAATLAAYFYAVNVRQQTIDALFAIAGADKPEFTKKLVEGSAAITELLHTMTEHLQSSYESHKNTSWVAGWLGGAAPPTPWQRTLIELACAFFGNYYSWALLWGISAVSKQFLQAVHADFTIFNGAALDRFSEFRTTLIKEATDKNQRLRTTIQAYASKCNFSLEWRPDFFSSGRFNVDTELKQYLNLDPEAASSTDGVYGCST